MRNFSTLLFCAVAFAFASCSKSETPAIELSDARMKISAQLPTTATSYGDGLKSGLWDTADCLGAYVLRTAGGETFTTIDNLKYANVTSTPSATARFTSTATFNMRSGDVVVGYYPYSEEQSLVIDGTLSTMATKGSLAIVRPFTLGNQAQNGNGSMAHIGAQDFLVTTPVEITDAMLTTGSTTVVVPFMFRHAFSGLQFVLTNNFSRAIRINSVSVTAPGCVLEGEFAIDITSGKVSVVNGSDTLTLTVDNSESIATGSTFTGYALVNAATLPVGAEINVVTSSGTFTIPVTQEIAFEAGYVHTLNIALTTDRLTDAPDTALLEACWGEWKLSTYCGTEVDFDVYMALRDDYTFSLYQRTTLGMTSFTGTYTFDTRAAIIAGEYSDGTPWAASYAVESADETTLTWVNAANSNERSVYVRCQIPAMNTSAKGKSVESVKRFL